MGSVKIFLWVLYNYFLRSTGMILLFLTLWCMRVCGSLSSPLKVQMLMLFSLQWIWHLQLTCVKKRVEGQVKQVCNFLILAKELSVVLILHKNNLDRLGPREGETQVDEVEERVGRGVGDGWRVLLCLFWPKMFLYFLDKI